MLPLPDRHSPLEFLDHVAAGVEGSIAVRGRGNDHHRGVTHFQGADAMFHRHAGRPASLGFLNNPGELGIGHRAEGTVLQAQD